MVPYNWKKAFINWLLITNQISGTRFASARPEYLGGRSTKDDGVKGLRALPTFNQEGIEGTFLGGYEAPKVEAQVSDILFDIFFSIISKFTPNKTKPHTTQSSIACHMYLGLWH